MKKAIFVSLGMTALLGAGCLFANPSTPSGSDVLVPPQEAASPVFDSTTASSTEGRLQIHVKTPVMTAGLTQERRDAFNARLSTAATDQIAGFKSDFGDPNNLDPRGDEAPPWTLDSSFTIPTSTGRIQSVLVDSYQYTGGAHGMESEAAYMFDVQQGAFLTLSDLFDPGTDYLSQLATSSHAVLMQREYVMDDPEWVSEGTAASSTNYSIVYAVPDGLAVYFSDYQVAPHAVGPQTVIIPWSQLTGVKNEYLP